MSRDDIQREMREALRIEPFFQGGVNRLVKVLPLRGPLPTTIGGFVTQERFLLGLTPQQIEEALGLERKSLLPGCRVFRLTRPPGPSEVEYELTTKYPDGIAHTSMSSDKYPASNKNHIHQWRLTTQLPITLVRQLPPDTPYTVAP
jgi:hypothetical protein